MIKLILFLSVAGLGWYIEEPYSTMEECLDRKEYLIEYHSEKDGTEIESIRCVESK